MLSIAIYSDNFDDTMALRSKIQYFLVKNKILAKIKIFENMEKFITIPEIFDIYFIDMDSSDNVLKIGAQIIDINLQSYFIYYSNNKSFAYDASTIRADYFLLKPINQNELEGVMNDIKRHIRIDSIIIKTPKGDRRVYTNDLNYINIVKRCLCYHLIDGSTFDGQILRGAFEKAIYPLQKHPKLVFLPPSLLVNMTNIKILNKEYVIFENDDILYFSRKSYDLIKQKWEKYNEI